MAPNLDYIERRIQLWQLDFYYVFEDCCWILLIIIAFCLCLFFVSYVWSSFGALLTATTWILYLGLLILTTGLVIICAMSCLVGTCECAGDGCSKLKRIWSYDYGKDKGDITEIAGFYVDTKYFKGNGTFAGTRMLSRDVDDISIIGTDDGINYWTLKGGYIDRTLSKFVVRDKTNYFEKYGTFRNGKIFWKYGGEWRKVIKTKDISWSVWKLFSM